MTILIIAVVLILGCFAGVLLFGAPYLPTLTPQVSEALRLADLQPGQTLLELGCGDGKVLLAAARQGISAVGYELNPLLVLICKLRIWRYRQYVRVIWGDFWRADWPPAEAIFVFLLPKHMSRLHKKVMQYNHLPVKVVSFAFEVPAKRPTAESAHVFLYKYR